MKWGSKGSTHLSLINCQEADAGNPQGETMAFSTMSLGKFTQLTWRPGTDGLNVIVVDGILKKVVRSLISIITQRCTSALAALFPSFLFFSNRAIEINDHIRIWEQVYYDKENPSCEQQLAKKTVFSFSKKKKESCNEYLYICGFWPLHHNYSSSGS